MLELVLSSSILITILGGAQMMLAASSGVARSTNDQGVAGERAARALRTLSQSLRRGSLASMRALDGSNFGDGANDVGIQLREVANFNGVPVLNGIATYHLSGDQLLRTEDGLDSVIVTGVTSFTVARSGNIFTFDVRTRSGPADDRARTAHATMQVAARNP
jgi:hypothetical protein